MTVTVDAMAPISSIDSHSQTTVNWSQCELEPLVVRRPLFAYLYVYVFAAVIAVGVPCNALTFFVLLTDRMASTTRVFLLAIAAADNLILVLLLCQYPLSDLYLLTNWPVLQPFGYAGPYLNVVSNTAKLIQVWLTVTISLDRFFCVCFPLSAARLCSSRRACIVALILPPVSLVLNVPRFLLYSVVLHQNLCSGRMHFDVLWLGIPKFFKLIFFEVFECAFYFIVPLLLLVVLNGALIRSLFAASRKRQQMVLRSASSRPGGRSAQASGRDNVITLTLIAVVTAFIVFETPAALLNIVSLILNVAGLQALWESFWIDETVNSGIAICLLLALLNSSTNFFLYILVNRNFRRNLIALFYRRFKHTNGSTTGQSTLRR